MSAAPSISNKIAIKPLSKTRKERKNEKEVTTLRERTTNILPATTFKRIITQEAAIHSSSRLRFNADAVNALQVAAEQELTTIFTGAAFCAELGKRDTVTVEDMQNFLAIRNL